MKLRLFLLVLCTFFAPVWADSTKWEKEIAAFEKADTAQPPAKGGTLFIGSSSIRLWKTLAKDFPGKNVINRGFGGSEVSDSIEFIDRIVIPYAPKKIVMYAGTNDIHNGKSPERVFEDFKSFVHKVREKLPEVQIAYISIAGNPARWAEVEKVKEANRLVRDFTRGEKDMNFIDVFSKMLGPDGMPKPDIFVSDRLHMNEKGYAIWREVVGTEVFGAE